jgi:hypothetical protein
MCGRREWFGASHYVDTATVTLNLLQNLCGDRSVVHALQPALDVSGDSSRVECEDCLLETMLGNVALNVGVPV